MRSIVISFGGRGVGKTTLLVRLSRWLLYRGYNLEQVTIFSPIFMSVNVMNNKCEVLCQILDAEGSQYFDKNIPLQALPQSILQQILMPDLWKSIRKSIITSVV